jgi:DNA-binding XRE family transcriptional regulator
MKTAGKLKYYRQLKDVSQDELGKQLGGLSKTNISLWENGKKAIPVKYWQQIAVILDVDFNNIFGAKSGNLLARTKASMGKTVSHVCPLTGDDQCPLEGDSYAKLIFERLATLENTDKARVLNNIEEIIAEKHSAINGGMDTAKTA